VIMKKNIAKAVKERMEELGETFKSVSEGSGVSTNIVQRIRDEGNYQIEGLEKVLEHLDIGIDVYSGIDQAEPVHSAKDCPQCEGEGYFYSDNRMSREPCGKCQGRGWLKNVN